MHSNQKMIATRQFELEIGPGERRQKHKIKKKNKAIVYVERERMLTIDYYRNLSISAAK